ncbi:YcxB family protein [Alteromonas gilva]|uniref:YcxB family protein n=1 Tax=Alteromonas gilva TaxID=2987522 RepID=A0ABT5L0H0_9ALTE|nr:YcxB family protein [Alteromonas gilva]MDC8829372.1 YcxB family protein [Alteromonas gilva]
MYSITVHYKLTEYCSLLLKVCEAEVGSKTANKWYFKLLAYPIWGAIYLFKLFKEGKCQFVFSKVGVARKSNSGISKLQWSEVAKVVNMEHFYLLVGNENGVAPVPKRCLSSNQQALLETWAMAKLTSEL